MEILFVIVPIVIGVLWSLKIWIDYRRDVKALNDEFIREAKRINRRYGQ